VGLGCDSVKSLAVTGASGFIGTTLCVKLMALGNPPVRIGRDFFSSSDCRTHQGVLRGVDSVIHLAGQAHATSRSNQHPLATFRRVNVDQTVMLAKSAAMSGVGRFIFVSSIGVHGKESGSEVFRETDRPCPSEDYAVSKWEAEMALRKLAPELGLELIVVRPPLVHGPGVKGNFLRLLNLSTSRIPLPLASVNNSRSFVGVENLCDLLILCAEHPDAADHGGLYLASDDEDISTPDLLCLLGDYLGNRARLFHCPTSLLRAVSFLINREGEFDKLTASLRVCSQHARDVLGWQPTRSLRDGLRDMAGWYQMQRRQ